jgi:hypothetical protein
MCRNLGELMRISQCYKVLGSTPRYETSGPFPLVWAVIIAETQE